MKTKLEYQDYSTKLVVAITGESHEDVEQQFWSFYNHGATENPEPFWMGEFRLYFYTTKEKLLKAMTNASLFFMLNDAEQLREVDYDGWYHCCKGIKGGFLPQARINAQERFDSLERNPRVRNIGINLDFYNLGTIRAENLSDVNA